MIDGYMRVSITSLFWALVTPDEDDDPATAEEFWILSFSLFVDAKIYQRAKL